MTSVQVFALICSIPVLLLLFAPVWYVYHAKRPNRHLFALSWVLALIWLLRFSAGLLQPLEGAEALTPVEVLFDSLVHTLQTFSMDEDYTAYTAAGKTFFANKGFTFFAEIYGIVNSFLGILAPILGGALLLDILSGFFPFLRLNLYFQRDKFVFSELNEQAVTLAEDLAERKDLLSLISPSAQGIHKRKPLFIFSDAYLDRSSENSSELYARAKDLGAVCINLDLTHLHLQRSQSVTYFLIHSDPAQNASALSQLLDGADADDTLWPVNEESDNPATRIYVFGQDGTNFSMSKQVCANHSSAAKRALIRPIPDKRNTAFNLMYETPLFLPLLSVPAGKSRELNVTILGSDLLSQELLKAVYWCGQMHSVRLHINLVCQDADKMRQHLNEECPELLPSCEPDSPLLLLRPYADDVSNPPYCESLRILTASDSASPAGCPQEILKKTDYFILSMGSDAQNLHLTEQLRLYTVRAAMESGISYHPVIAPAISNHNLADMVRVLKPGSFDPYITPFASVKDQYSFKQVFLNNFTVAARTTDALYSTRHQQKDRDDIYNSISSTARCVHAPYKLFDLGLIREVDLTVNIAQRYKVPAFSLTREQEDIFAWIEHRRWNAFLRSLGFICPTRQQLDSFFGELKTAKSVLNKLHPCLVESQITPEPLPVDSSYDPQRYDRLDYVSMYVYKLRCNANGQEMTAEGLAQADYKIWDYPKYDGGVSALVLSADED